MKKSDILVMPQFFDRYIQLVENEDILISLEKYLEELNQINLQQLEAIGDKTYAEGKWTLKDIFQHMIDTERIQAYRALRFSRNDNTTLPGFEENLFAQNTNASQRTIKDLISEYKVVRQSTIFLFKNFTPEMMRRSGICYKIELSVLALGFVITGHQKHHMNIISERYLSL